ncbi:RNA-directed DNA polymerase, eukaryota, reverse transcriptase zinc-binding domain protein [Tanacetum coccineum]|uniref:RNA-directed DNA polymerase, eukaryota, reverse transcriptase zinc-binding domain protein n=1 Tax=Tanacetum coccineum TaxID=301880 RepID=A0ABQ5AVX6_9ASTR
MHKHRVNHRAWVLMGDFNVTLKREEHSNGSLRMTIDMSDFKDVVNAMEVEDLCSTGSQFTWTKSLKNVMCNTLKKLDRIIINDKSLLHFKKARGIFIPYLVSDHCPAIMTIPKGASKKKKSFRFANYVADKKDFLDVVREGWNHDVRGCQMYRVVDAIVRGKLTFAYNLLWAYWVSSGLEGYLLKDLRCKLLLKQIVRRTSTPKLLPVGRTNSSFAAKPETVNRVCEIVKIQLALPDGSVTATRHKFSALGADSIDTVLSWVLRILRVRLMPEIEHRLLEKIVNLRIYANGSKAEIMKNMDPALKKILQE